jgi:hypothetical protein
MDASYEEENHDANESSYTVCITDLRAETGFIWLRIRPTGFHDKREFLDKLIDNHLFKKD